MNTRCRGRGPRCALVVGWAPAVATLHGAATELYVHDNALLTPHVAGSLGVELGRPADVVLDELRRVVQGRPLDHEVEAAQLSITA